MTVAIAPDTALCIRKPRRPGPSPLRNVLSRPHRRKPSPGPLTSEATRGQRQERVARWLEIVSVPNTQAGLVLADIAYRWADAGIAVADVAPVADIVESRAAFDRITATLAVAGLIEIRPAAQGSAPLIVPCVDAETTPDAWRAAALTITGPARRSGP